MRLMSTSPSPYTQLRFAGVGAKKRPKHEYDWLTQYTSIGDHVASLDIGSNGMKTIIHEGDKEAHTEKWVIENGASLYRTGEKGEPYIDDRAKKILMRNMQKFVDLMKEHSVPLENIDAVATAGLRSASNGQEIIDEIYKEFGIRIRTITGQEEGRLAYLVALKGESVGEDEPVEVWEIGGGSTEIMPGNGPTRPQTELGQLLEFGTTRLGLQDPWNLKEIDVVRQTVRAELKRKLRDDSAATAQGRRVFIKSSNLEDVQAAHVAKGFGENIQNDPISREEIQYFLSREGLEYLENDAKVSSGKGKGMRKGLELIDQVKLITKLVILDELMEAENVSYIELGFKGGLKFAVLEEFLARIQQNSVVKGIKQIFAKPEDPAPELVASLTQPHVLQRLFELAPEPFRALWSQDRRN